MHSAKNSADSVTISVVIVSWNAKAYLEQCLNSLISGTSSCLLEIIVVDNASIDGSPEMVTAKFPNVKLIRNISNLGFAKANNVGITQSSGKYIALVNSDVKVLGNCVGDLAGYLGAHPNVGVVGPKILNGDMSVQSSARRFPTLWNNFCEASGLARTFNKSQLLAGEHMLYFDYNNELQVDVLVGCFWLIRREAIEIVGLLDEGFFIYAEDVDWCRRCWSAGWEVRFWPGAEAIHYRGGSSANDPARFAVEQQRAVLRYWDKYHGLVGQLGIRMILLARHLSRCLALSVSKKVSDVRFLTSGACLRALLSRHSS